MENTTAPAEPIGMSPPYPGTSGSPFPSQEIGGGVHNNTLTTKTTETMGMNTVKILSQVSTCVAAVPAAPSHLSHDSHFVIVADFQKPQAQGNNAKLCSISDAQSPTQNATKTITPQASGYQKDSAPARHFSGDWEKSPKTEDLSPPPADLNNFPRR